MAEVKLSALPAAAAPNGTEVVPVVQGGVTKRLPVGSGNGLATLIDGKLDPAQSATIAAGRVEVSSFSGYDPTGATPSTAAVQAAVTWGVANGCRSFMFRGTPVVDGSIAVGARAINAYGTGKTSTRIDFTGTGALFELGTDDGLAHDRAGYDGPAQGFTVDEMTLNCSGGTRVALANGNRTYRAGTFAIRDWRSGNVTVGQGAAIEGFETGVWAIQSDFDRFDGDFIGCKTGWYLGPRSDQFVSVRAMHLWCDRAYDVDSAWNGHMVAPRVIMCGLPTTRAARIRSQYPRAVQGWTLDSPWFETLSGQGTIEAFLEVGVGDAHTTSGVTITRPVVVTDTAVNGHHANALVRAGNCDDIRISDLPSAANGWKLLDQLIEVVNNSNPIPPSFLLEARNTLNAAAFRTLNSRTDGGSHSTTKIEWSAAGAAGQLFTGGLVRAGTVRSDTNMTVGLQAQTLAANGAVTFNASGGGDIHRVTLGANATSSTITPAAATNAQSQRITIEWLQDATGNRTYAWPANCRFAGGAAPPPSTTPGQLDSVSFRWDNATARWIETGRSAAVPA